MFGSLLRFLRGAFGPEPINRRVIVLHPNDADGETPRQRLCGRLSANDPAITHLDMERWVPAVDYGNAVGTALQSNTHVVELTLNMVQLCNYEECDQLVTAIREHSNLRTLALRDVEGYLYDRDDNSDHIHSIILRAVAGSSTIQELYIDTSPPGAALADVLHQSSASKIKSLSLYGCDFTPIEKALVASALQENATLEMLRLVHPRYMLLPNLQHHPALRDLQLNGYNTDGTVDEMVDGLVEMLHGTVQLCSVWFEEYVFNESQTERLIPALSESATITSLTLDDCKFTEDATPVFMGYLSSSDAVRNLSIVGYFNTTFVNMDFELDTTIALWQRTLRQNWTLHNFDVSFSYDYPEDGEDQWRKFISRYCNRNLYLPDTVARQTCLGENDGESTSTSIFPLLFSAAQQSPQISATRTLTGLLTLSHTIGPQEQHEH